MTDEQMDQARADALNAILNDDAPRKVVVAGPGTGKSYTFKRLLDANGAPALALTFLNTLVNDLRVTLGEDVAYSFHGFAKKLLHSVDVPGVTRSVDYYPAIEVLYEVDLLVTDSGASEDEISAAFMNLREELPVIPNVLRSGTYYDAVGHTDSVYRVLKGLQRDPQSTPRYKQVVVDEYQDFSLLEVRLIGCLAEASPVLIVGDDDQALYLFRHASAKYIRELASHPEYKSFDLPYCTRCTAVLVNATHRVVTEAQKVGRLKGRIAKPYLCYLSEKRADSDKYPTIAHARVSVDSNKAPQIARYIAHRIRSLDPAEVQESRNEDYPTVLIIGKKHYTQRVYDHLKKQGVPNLRRKERVQVEMLAMDGFKRLRRNERSRLGWRILLHFHEPPGWDTWVRKALLEGTELFDLLDADYRAKQQRMIALLDELVAGRELGEDQILELEQATRLTLPEIQVALGVVEADEPPEMEGSSDEDPGAPTILFTTMVGSKGLQAGHVFLVGVNQGTFPKYRKPSDEEICQLIVALTRGKKSCTVVSCDSYGGKRQGRSVFMDWLAPTLSEVYVNKAHLESLGA